MFPDTVEIAKWSDDPNYSQGVIIRIYKDTDEWLFESTNIGILSLNCFCGKELPKVGDSVELWIPTGIDHKGQNLCGWIVTPGHTDAQSMIVSATDENPEVYNFVYETNQE